MTFNISDDKRILAMTNYLIDGKADLMDLKLTQLYLLFLTIDTLNIGN
jgi:hypothetical protein